MNCIYCMMDMGEHPPYEEAAPCIIICPQCPNNTTYYITCKGEENICYAVEWYIHYDKEIFVVQIDFDPPGPNYPKFYLLKAKNMSDTRYVIVKLKTAPNITPSSTTIDKLKTYILFS